MNLSLPENVNKKNHLYRAVALNNVTEVKQLLQQRAYVNMTDSVSNSTPLHIAATENLKESHFQVAELLLKKGANVNARDVFGRTPVYYLVKKCNVRILKLFFNFGAEVSAKDNSDETFLFPAVMCNENLEVVQLLVDLGLDINYCRKGAQTPMGMPLGK